MNEKPESEYLELWLANKILDYKLGRLKSEGSQSRHYFNVKCENCGHSQVVTRDDLELIY